MSRPVKWRRVDSLPQVGYFKPAGVPLGGLDEVVLSVEEVEAIRLKDAEGLQQTECAERMHISRTTFHRVLESARSKLANALINGKAIRIEGGTFEMAMRRFRCINDGKEWDVPFEKMVMGRPQSCPECHSSNIQPVLPPGFGGRRMGPGRGMGRGRGRQQGRRW